MFEFCFSGVPLSSFVYLKEITSPYVENYFISKEQTDECQRKEDRMREKEEGRMEGGREGL